MPVIRFITVVLPAPFGPIRLTISPSRTSKERSLTACRPPKRFVTLLSSSISGLRAEDRGLRIGSNSVLSPQSSSLHDLDARLAKQPVRPVGHQQHQDRAKEQQACDA